MLHNAIPLADRHPAHNYEYANAAARTGATGFVAGDVGKLALQLDNYTLWILTAATPTWQAFGLSDHGSLAGLADDDHPQYALSGHAHTGVYEPADADIAKTDVAQSWTGEQTFKELKDTVHTIADGAAFEIDPANGSVQIVTLGAARTPAATNFSAGQTVLLGIDDGADYAITWTTVAPTWVKPGGTAAAPTLATAGYTWILLWKVGSTIYGAEVGKP